jgi:hypothetical protein
MISGFEIAALALMAGAAWLWLDSLKAREIAVRAARSACTAESLLLLDDTVAIANIRLQRDDDGQLTLQRAYDFEFSDTGNNRLRGSIVLLGKRVVMLNVGTRPPADTRTLH